MPIKTSKRKKDACLTQKAQSAYKRRERKKAACLTFCVFYAFYAHKKHLKRKLLV